MGEDVVVKRERKKIAENKFFIRNNTHTHTPGSSNIQRNRNRIPTDDLLKRRSSDIDDAVY